MSSVKYFIYLTWNTCITLSSIEIVYGHVLELNSSFLGRNFFLLLGSFLEVLLLLVIVLCLTLSFHRSHLSLDCATLKTFPRPTTRSMLPGGPAGLRQPRLSPGATSGGCSASDHCYDQPAPPSLLAKVISGGINPKILRKSDTNTSPPPPSQHLIFISVR